MSGVDTAALVSQSEYARRRGCSREAVRRKVANKQIDAFGPEKMICPQLADAQWAQRVRARGDSGKAPTEPTGVEQPRASSQTPAPDAPKDDGEYSVNRARRERYEADLAEMKLREQQGDLVRVVEVRAEMAKQIGQVRMNLLQIPSRLAPLLANEADQAKVHALLDAEIRAVLTNVTRGE